MELKSVKRIAWIFVGIFLFLALVFTILWFNEIVGIGVFISFIFIFIIFLFGTIIYSTIWQKIKSRQKEEEKKPKKVISDDDAKQLIKNRLAQSDYADYINETINDGIVHYGDIEPTPVYIGYFKGEYHKEIVIGLVNLMTSEKSILLWDKTKKSWEMMQREIYDAANRLATIPTKEKIRRILEESALTGISREILEPFPEKREEKTKEGEFEKEEEKK